MTFAIGQFSLTLLSGGRFWLDGGGMFGVLPRVLWSRSVQPDEANRILLEARCLLIRAAEGTLLVDTGLGSRWDAKWTDIYRLTPGKLRAELAREGLKPDDIRFCVLTHLHFDHVGGALENMYEQWVPAFPKAQYLVQRSEFEYSMNPGMRQRGSYRTQDFLPLVQFGKLRFVEGDEEVLPGVRLLKKGGHSTGFQIIRLESEGCVAYYPGDLIPSAVHLRPAVTTAFDLAPEEVVRGKLDLLQQAETEEAVLILGHDPHHPAGSLRKDQLGNYFLEKLKES
jgi:glyoxylase-like metal-dependent hydrolase (beta-lactamase superfamily II)